MLRSLLGPFRTFLAVTLPPGGGPSIPIQPLAGSRPAAPVQPTPQPAAVQAPPEPPRPPAEPALRDNSAIESRGAALSKVEVGRLADMVNKASVAGLTAADLKTVDEVVAKLTGELRGQLRSQPREQALASIASAVDNELHARGARPMDDGHVTRANAMDQLAGGLRKSMERQSVDAVVARMTRDVDSLAQAGPVLSNAEKAKYMELKFAAAAAPLPPADQATFDKLQGKLRAEVGKQIDAAAQKGGIYCRTEPKDFVSLGKVKAELTRQVAAAPEGSPQRALLQAKLDQVQSAWDQKVAKVGTVVKHERYLENLTWNKMPTADLVAACKAHPDLTERVCASSRNPAVLTAIAAEFGDSKVVRNNLLANPKTPAAALDKLAPHCANDVNAGLQLKTAIKREGLREGQDLVKGKDFMKLSDAKRSTQDELAKCQPGSPSAQIAQTKLNSVQMALTKELNKEAGQATTPDKLDKLAARINEVGLPAADVLDICKKSPELAAQVANTSLAHDVLVALAEKHGAEPKVRDKLLANEATPPEALQKLLAHPGNQTPQVLTAMASHGNATGELLRQLATQPNVSDNLLVAVANHKHAGAEALKAVADRSENFGSPVRQALAANPLTPKEMLNKLAGNGSEMELLALTRNPAADQALLEKLAVKTAPGGGYETVRAAALDAMGKLSAISPATLATINQNFPMDLQKAVDRRANKGMEAVTTAAADPGNVAMQLRATQEASKATVADLQKLADTPGITADQKKLLETQIKSLKNADEQLLVPKLNAQVRMSALTDAVSVCRDQSLEAGAALGRLDKNTLRDAMGASGGAQVMTYSQLAKVQAQVEQPMATTMDKVKAMQGLNEAHGGNEQAWKLLAELKSACTFKDRPQTLVELELNKVKLIGELDKQVPGKVSQSERNYLVELSNIVTENITAYQAGKGALATRKTEIDAAMNDAKQSFDVQAVFQFTEAKNRLGGELQARLTGPLSIDPTVVKGVKTEAQDMMRNEVKPAIAALLDKYEQKLGLQLTPEIKQFLDLQRQKLDKFGSATTLAEIKTREAALESAISRDPKLAAELKALQAAANGAVEGYQAFAAGADRQLSDLQNKHTTIERKVAFITETLKSAASGGTRNYTLSLSVEVPVPGLAVDMRGGYTFSFVRNSETNKIEVVKQLEAGAGVSYANGTVGAELYGGAQQKFEFETIQDASLFLQRCETGLPRPFVFPNPIIGGYAGAKLTAKLDIPGVKVTGEVSGQKLWESNPDGTKTHTVQGQAKGVITLRSSVLAQGSLDVTVTHASRTGLQIDGKPDPKQTKVFTTCEVALRAGMKMDHISELAQQIFGYADSVESGVDWTKKKVGKELTGVQVGGVELSSGGKGLPEINSKFMEGFRRFVGTPVGAGSTTGLGDGSSLEAGMKLRVEKENGKVIAVMIGVNVKAQSQSSVSCGIATGKLAKSDEVVVYETLFVAKNKDGLDRMQRYYMTEQSVFQKTCATSGWTDTTVINGKTLAEHKQGWDVQIAEKGQLEQLKKEFKATGGKAPADGDKMLLGEKVSVHAARWVKELGDEAKLKALKSAFMADNSFFMGNYYSAKKDKGMSDSFVFKDEAVVGGKPMHLWEKEWALEKSAMKKAKVKA